MILTYSHIAISLRTRKNPYDLRRKCESVVYSYFGEDNKEYRREFMVECGNTVPDPPIHLDTNLTLFSQVTGLIKPNDPRWSK